MTNFNHKKAWRELVCPALMALPQDVLQLVLQVMNDSRGLKQNDNLSMPWPDGLLREKFEKIPSGDLARASRIVWAAGHWHPGTNNWFRLLMRTGTYWKFASYADEILRERCEIPRNWRASNGFAFELHEGFIRVCVDYDKSWQWTEVAIATRENFKSLKPMVPKLNGDSTDDNWKIINEAVENMTFFRPSPEDSVAKFFDLKEYYDG